MEDKNPKSEKAADDKLEKIKKNMKKEDILDDNAPPTEEEIEREKARVALEEAKRLAQELWTQETAKETVDDGFMQVKQEKSEESLEMLISPEPPKLDADGFTMVVDLENTQITNGSVEIPLDEEDLISPSIMNSTSSSGQVMSMFSSESAEEEDFEQAPFKEESLYGGAFEEEPMDESTALENAMAMAKDSLVQSGEWKDPFEEIEESVAVKKYIIYVNRDFVEKLDAMDTDTRNAYVNESLQIRTSLEGGAAKKKGIQKTFKHIAVALATIIIGTPAVFFLVNKSIDLTLSNYDYVQKNFEALYKQRADRSKAIQRANINIIK